MTWRSLVQNTDRFCELSEVSYTQWLLASSSERRERPTPAAHSPTATSQQSAARLPGLSHGHGRTNPTGRTNPAAQGKACMGHQCNRSHKILPPNWLNIYSKRPKGNVVILNEVKPRERAHPGKVKQHCGHGPSLDSPSAFIHHQIGSSSTEMGNARCWLCPGNLATPSSPQTWSFL